MPHLQRAFVITLRLQRLEMFSQHGTAALEKMPWGAILIDSDGRISFTNRLAEAVLQRGDGLTMRFGLLATRKLGHHNKLFQAIALAERGEGSAIRIARGETASAYVLLISSLDARRMWRGISKPMILVAITDPERRPDVNVEQLKSLYGLTAAEAALAARLVIAGDLSRAARQLGITHETARTYIKRIFPKIGVSGQNELVSKIVHEAMILSM